MSAKLLCLYGNCKKGGWDLKEIEDYLEHNSSSVNILNNGETPLLTALRDKRCPVDVIKVLLKYGANKNVKYKNGHSPLVHSLLHGASKDVIELLIDAGGLASCDRFFGSSLHCALLCDGELQKDIIELLIKSGANTNATNGHNCSVICAAIELGITTSSIKMLCDAGVPLSGCPKHLHPLICATNGIYKRDRLLTTNLVEWILLKAAPFIKNDSHDRTPLQGALRNSNYEVGAIHLLLQHFPDVNIVDGLGGNLLHLALSNQHGCDITIINLLIKRGVSLDKVNKYGETPFHKAVCNSAQCSSQVIKLLIKNGAALNAVDKWGETHLERLVKYLSVGKGDFLTFKILLSAGACRQSILERVLDKCNSPIYKSHFLRYFKMLLKYNLLENPNVCIESVIAGHKDYKTLSKYWKDCVSELKEMESVTVGGSRTLREFLNSYFTPSKEAACWKPPVEMFDCDQLLRIKAKKVFPLFSDIISDKVDRWFMEAKLQEVQVYFMKCSPPLACREEVQLPYEAVCKIVQYLVDEDFFSLIVAFTCMDEHACSNRPKKRIGGKKRSSKESTEYGKKLRSNKLK